VRFFRKQFGDHVHRLVGRVKQSEVTGLVPIRKWTSPRERCDDWEHREYLHAVLSEKHP